MTLYPGTGFMLDECEPARWPNRPTSTPKRCVTTNVADCSPSRRGHRRGTAIMATMRCGWCNSASTNSQACATRSPVWLKPAASPPPNASARSCTTSKQRLAGNDRAYRVTHGIWMPQCRSCQGDDHRLLAHPGHRCADHRPGRSISIANGAHRRSRCDAPRIRSAGLRRVPTRPADSRTRSGCTAKEEFDMTADTLLGPHRRMGAHPRSYAAHVRR